MIKGKYWPIPYQRILDGSIITLKNSYRLAKDAEILLERGVPLGQGGAYPLHVLFGDRCCRAGSAALGQPARCRCHRVETLTVAENEYQVSPVCHLLTSDYGHLHILVRAWAA